MIIVVLWYICEKVTLPLSKSIIKDSESHVGPKFPTT